MMPSPFPASETSSQMMPFTPPQTSSHAKKERKQPSKWRETLLKFHGPSLMLLAEAFGGCMAATTRLLEMPQTDNSPGMNTLQILFARFSITALLSILYMWWRKVEHAPLGPPEVRLWLVLRGFAGFCGVFGFYYSLQYLPMTEAIIILFITPIITAYASSIFLGELFSRKQLLAGIICFLGIIVVADPFGLSAKASLSHGTPPSQPDSVFGSKVTPFQRFSAIALGLLADFAAAGAYTFIRLIGNKTHTLISVNYYAIFATILSAFILILPIFPSVNFRLPHGAREWLLLAGIGVFGFMLQFLMTAALVIDRSSRTTNMLYSQVVFALALDWAIWGAVPTLTSWIGGAVVVGSVIWGSLQKEEVKQRGDEEYSAVPAEEFELTEEDEDFSDDGQQEETGLSKSYG